MTWIRPFHRWTSIVFTAIVAAIFATLAVKLGARFSRKLVTPSAATGLRPREKITRLSQRCAFIGCGAPIMRQSIWRVSATETGALCSVISRALAIAASISAPGA